MTRLDEGRTVNPAARPGPARPPHLRPALLAVVALGGVLGTAARMLLALAIPHEGPFPLATFAVNVTGAFILGALLEAVSHGGPDVGRRRALRLFAGTGVLGGYTTYSAFAVEATALLRAEELWWTAAYALGTVVVGGLASLAGIAAAGRLVWGRGAR